MATMRRMLCGARHLGLGRDQRGQVITTELAFTLPIFALLFMGASEIANLIHIRLVMQSAVREGALYAARLTKTSGWQASTNSYVDSRIRQRVKATVPPQVTSEASTEGPPEQQWVEVCATYSPFYDRLFPLGFLYLAPDLEVQLIMLQLRTCARLPTGPPLPAPSIGA